MRRILPRRLRRRPRRRATTCLVIFLICVTVLVAAAVLAATVAAVPPAVAAVPPAVAAVPPAVAAGAPAGSSIGTSAGTAGTGAAWAWPLQPLPTVLRRFVPPSAPWGPGHRGVDLAASAGQQVRSAGAGVVTYAGMLAGRGVVSVTHGALRTTYEPVRATVSVGQKVERGHVLGTLEGRAGHCGGRACLHWGLLRGDEYLDPLALLRRGPSRLLPVWQVPAPAQGPVPPQWRTRPPRSVAPATPGPSVAGAGTGPPASPKPAVAAGAMAGAALSGAALIFAAGRHRLRTRGGLGATRLPFSFAESSQSDLSSTLKRRFVNSRRS